ncbi:hypothetical protein [uncultured Roseobacter sp.]|uniref:hypothetical protein n=1 Tax=uncultured Roseobacter sp. TaxID=114847 RepID=UPI00261A3E5C|nr:hypothetical protein [uncultured Roseobacter sp.]
MPFHLVKRCSFVPCSPRLLSFFGYASILTAIALGFWAFGEIPSLWTGGGVAIIFAGALVVLRGEKGLEKPTPLTKA